MTPDKALLKTLVEKVANYKASVPVYRIPERSLDDLDRSVVQAGRNLAKAAGYGEMRYSIRRAQNSTVVQFQEGMSAHVLHASGAMSLHRGWRPLDKIITPYADRADLKLLQAQAEEAVKRLSLVQPGKTEELRFERLWRLKAAGITREGKTGAVALTRVVGAFRRYIGGMPVWGRASIFAHIAAEGQIAAAGADWRPIVEQAVDSAKVLSPEDGAVRVLQELQTFLPDKIFTRRDYTPAFFSLGYISLPKRRAQSVMQPVYVAMFNPVGTFPSVGRLIVVPAGLKTYESIARTVVTPPLGAHRPAPGKPPTRKTKSAVSEVH